MITKLFDKDSPILWFVWPIIVLFFWIPSFTTNQAVTISTTNNGLIETLIKSLIDIKWLATSLTLVIVILQGYILKYIAAKHGLVKVNSFYIPMIYCLTLSIFQFDIILNPYLLTSTFLLFAINLMLDLGKEGTNQFKIFEASLLIGFAGIMYYSMLYFIITSWVALFLFKSFNLKEWIQPIIGIFIPIAYLSAYWYWNDTFTTEITALGKNLFDLSFFEKSEESTSASISRFWIVGIIGFSANTYFSQLRNNIMRTKYSHLFFVWVVFICLITALFSTFSMTSFFISSAMIAATFYSVYAANAKKKIVPELLLWVGILLIIINYLVRNNYL